MISSYQVALFSQRILDSKSLLFISINSQKKYWYGPTLEAYPMISLFVNESSTLIVIKWIFKFL